MFNKNMSADDSTPESMSQNIVNSPGAQAFQAGRDMYINRAKQPRHITEQYKKEIQKFLPTDKTKPVKVMVRHGVGPEAYQFAVEHREYINSLGYQVKAIDTLIDTEPEYPQQAVPNSEGGVDFIVGRQD